MIVVDASAMVDFLVKGPGHGAVAARLTQTRRFACPHLIDAEVGQVLRRFERSGQIDQAQAHAALDDLGSLPMDRYAHGPLMLRAFGLRPNATFYDALYLVLAEALAAPLLTRDARLATVPGHSARVDVV